MFSPAPERMVVQAPVAQAIPRESKGFRAAAELGGDVVANDLPHMREVSNIADSKGDFR